MTSIGRRVRRSVVVGGMVDGITPSRFARGRVWLLTAHLLHDFGDVRGLAGAPDAVWFNGLTLRPFLFSPV